VAVSNRWECAVYIFEKDAVSGYWNETRKLPTGVHLTALAVSGNVLAVGSRISQYPFVIVYKRNTADSSWARTMNLTSPIGSTGDEFGYSVSVDGDVMIVGAYASSSYKGATYIYEKNQSTWELTANLAADDGSEKDHQRRLSFRAQVGYHCADSHRKYIKLPATLTNKFDLSRIINTQY
jgi:hypothetical protein